MLINNVWRRRLFFLISLLNSLFLLNAQDTETRINLLLAKMTVEEKIGQLNQLPGDLMTGSDVGKEDLLAQIRAGKVGSVLSHTNFEQKIILQRAAVSESRLGIPLLFGFDVIHGYKTIFPIDEKKDQEKIKINNFF